MDTEHEGEKENIIAALEMEARHETQTLYKLIMRTERGHYECGSDESERVVKSSLNKAALIQWYNNNLDGVYKNHARPFSDGAETVRFNGNTGGGCSYVHCTLWIEAEELV